MSHQSLSRTLPALAILAVGLIAGLALSAFIAPGAALDLPPIERDWGPMWGRGGWDGWQAHAMIFSPVLLLLAVVGVWSLALTLYHNLWPGSTYVHHKSPVANGHQILAERFARGEIEEGEYRDKRRVLGRR